MNIRRRLRWLYLSICGHPVLGVVVLVTAFYWLMLLVLGLLL